MLALSFSNYVTLELGDLLPAKLFLLSAMLRYVYHDVRPSPLYFFLRLCLYIPN